MLAFIVDFILVLMVVEERFIRQIEAIGKESQNILLSSSVLVVGAGGLGSAVIAYLAGAGIGKIGIADGDIVELKNVHQVIHAGNIGINKAESAKRFVNRLNPEVEVETYGYLTFENWKIIKDYDLIVSCLDNFVARFLLNDACMLLKKPLVHGAVYKFEGEVMTISGSPCYRCLYPYSSEFKSSSVVSPVAGFFGCLQAVEAIKYLCGIKNSNIGNSNENNTDDNICKLLRIDLKSMEFLKIDVKKRRNCPVCNGKLKGIFPENYNVEQKCKILRLE